MSWGRGGGVNCHVMLANAQEIFPIYFSELRRIVVEEEGGDGGRVSDVHGSRRKPTPRGSLPPHDSLHLCTFLPPPPQKKVFKQFETHQIHIHCHSINYPLKSFHRIKMANPSPLSQMLFLAVSSLWLIFNACHASPYSSQFILHYSNRLLKGINYCLI